MLGLWLLICLPGLWLFICLLGLWLFICLPELRRGWGQDADTGRVMGTANKSSLDIVMDYFCHVAVQSTHEIGRRTTWPPVMAQRARPTCPKASIRHDFTTRQHQRHIQETKANSPMRSVQT
jgi:hypothetical protein